VIVGAVAENSIHAAAIRKAAADFAAANNAAVCRIPQGANALGLSRMGVLPTARDAQAMLADARQAYVIYGIEPGLDFADQARALKALGAAKVVAFSHFACRSTRAVADVILPIGALPEIDAVLTNLDGRDQHAISGGKLPGDARPGWRVLRALGGELGADGFAFTDLAGLRASLAPRDVAVAASPAQTTSGEGLELAVSQAIYRVDTVVRRAAALQTHPLNAGPRLVLNPTDAAAATLADGAMAKIDNGVGTATLQVAIDPRVAQGVAWVESGYGATAALGAGRVRVTGVL
jgi:NADH-quinone oxidoreductase subunit G